MKRVLKKVFEIALWLLFFAAMAFFTYGMHIFLVEGAKQRKAREDDFESRGCWVSNYGGAFSGKQWECPDGAWD